MTRITVLAAVVVVLAVGSGFPGSPEGGFRSPVTVAATGPGTVLVAEYTGRSVAEVDLEKGTLRRRMAMPLPPTGLAVDARRGRAYVTGEAPEGRVIEIDLASGQTAGTVAVGHSPLAPVLSPDGKILYVCIRFENSVSVVDVEGRKVIGRVPVRREPIAAALTPDGKLLVVANLLPDQRATADVVAATVSLIDTGTRKVAAEVLLPNGSTGLRGVCISPDGRYAYVTHTLARYQLPTTQLERGWMNTSAVSVLDLAGRKLVTSVLLDDVDRGAANPWGVACTGDGASLLVAHSGTHELSVIDRPALHKRLDEVAAGRGKGVSTSLEEVPNDLAFLVDLRRRVRLPGNGPRGIAVAGDRVVLGQYFSDDLAVVRRDGKEYKAAAVGLGPVAAMTQVRKGEMFFHDAQFCFQQWQSCSTCHPDSRVDGLNWDLLNDGLGNPKNTRTMVAAHRMAPVMSLGERGSAEAAVRAGLRVIQMTVRPEEDAAAIDAYLKALEPVPSPRRTQGGLSAAAGRGQALFGKAGCATCHEPPLFTDRKAHDVGTGGGVDKGKAFVTPRLVEVWRTGPYLHDGSAATVQEAFRKCGRAAAAKLSPEEQDDLAEYILSH